MFLPSEDCHSYMFSSWGADFSLFGGWLKKKLQDICVQINKQQRKQTYADVSSNVSRLKLAYCTAGSFSILTDNRNCVTTWECAWCMREHMRACVIRALALLQLCIQSVPTAGLRPDSALKWSGFLCATRAKSVLESVAIASKFPRDQWWCACENRQLGSCSPISGHHYQSPCYFEDGKSIGNTTINNGSLAYQWTS